MLSNVNCANNTDTKTPVTLYKTFQLKPDDVQLRFLEHPLYSLEYPEKFGFVDYSRIGYHPGVGISHVLFTIQQEKLPYQHLEIVVQKPGVRVQNNSSDVIKKWFSQEGTKWDTITTSTKTVCGIKTEYFEAFGTRSGSKPIYEDHQESLRGVAFDYADLIWSISLTWYYFKSEPPEVQTYFEHILRTFKILE